MRIFVFLFLSAGLCLLCSCNKADSSTYPTTLEDRIRNSSGNVRAKVNGKEWLSTLASATYHKKGRFGFTAQYYNDQMIDEQIGISSVYYLLNKAGIKYSNPYVKGYEDSTTALFAICDDDAVLANYAVIADSSVDNYITIDSYDPGTGNVKGKFQIAFYKEHALPEVTKADTLRFTDGAFDLRITY
jgi:hypothetical protein